MQEREAARAGGWGRSRQAVAPQATGGMIAGMTIRRRAKVVGQGLPRTPEGAINNCSLANGEPEADCQVCKGVCPDAKLYAKIAEAEAKKSEQQEPEKAADLVDRRNARGKRPPPPLEPTLGRMVEVVVAKAQRLLDDPQTFERMERALKVQGAATPEQVRQALNAIDEEAADAHLAALAAKAEFERWKTAADVYEGPMRDEAMKSLQRDKAAGEMSKAIAEADVKARIAKLFPDEYQALQANRSRAEMTVKQFERIADLLQKRSYSLSAMVQPRG